MAMVYVVVSMLGFWFRGALVRVAADARKIPPLNSNFVPIPIVIEGVR